MPFPHLPTPPSLFPTYLVPSLPFRRRQSSADSTTSTASDATTSPAPTSSSPIADPYLAGHASHLRCTRCLADLAPSTQIISKGFTGRHGRAYLVSASRSCITPPTTASSSSSSNCSSSSSSSSATKAARTDALPNLPNTYTHKPVPRQLVTGAHTVGDISCAHCGSVLGWKYLAAAEEAQRYKVGLFILETTRVCRAGAWEHADGVLDAQEAQERRRRGGDGRQRRRRRGSLAGPPHAMPDAAEEEEAVEFDSQDEDECEDLFMGAWTPQLAGKRRRARGFGED
ncbi:hypothetical protein LTR36_008780 [Oleoguttula mirabilis]|uniref:Yippee domain-containing protein n=1 Tax=Oleoguttula mirabilis TaxID=1507867 RepID=A0AAV9JVJ0_9PEZI|nr:hypothetical protein LTR36_008780 [Oleoguttula mirabilis]